METDRRVIDLLHSRLAQDALEVRERSRIPLGVQEGLERGDDVVGPERLAVLERDALAQLERPHLGRGVGSPAFGEDRAQGQIGVDVGKVLRDHLNDGDRSAVVHGGRFEGGSRRDDADAQRASQLGGRGGGGGGARTAGAATACRQELPGESRRQTDHGRPYEELAPSHASTQHLLQQMVPKLLLERRIGHASSPCAQRRR